MPQLTYDVFVCDPIPQAITSLVPNGERRMFSPLSVTLISGDEDAVLVDPPLTVAQAADVARWIEASGKRLTHIFATHGHGDHWFTAGLLAEQFGARVVASEPTIEQMQRNVAIRPQFWDALFPGQLPETDVTAVTVPGGVIELEGHELRIIDVGHTDTDGTSILHVPSIGLVVAGDVLYNNVHQYLREAQGDGIEQWLAAIDTVGALAPTHVVAGHKDKTRDDDATRINAETRAYLLTAREQLEVQTSAIDYFHAMLAAYPDRLNAGALWSSATALYPES
ncbi:MBL fold metallo-hydrolase [Microbacterium stercoris]|uniref:MBL fold metallo-hydrolase n=1 Tax=Microbacterium stercoris TaxID=2820289 RepID=A0A939QUZ2_9MICO|nr:MBL fold metallo-hydrolase [Microbacterium stercoris]MBO3665156.1 MBL fold metallo-hydrolase [Microbacterium stercoris]